MNGFYTTNGGKLYNCVEKDTGIGRSDFSYRVPAGYYSIPTRSVNPSTVLENCTSINSNGYGLQVDLANNVKIRNFHLVDPIGYKGKGSSLGGTNGQFDNSEVSIYASGNRVETLVWAKENVNTTFSGKIVSDAAKPFVIEGYRTKNVLVKDMEIVSKTLPAGSPGVTIVSTVPAGQATLQNVKVTSTGSPVPTPTVPGTAPTPTPTSTVTPGPSGKPDLVVTDISWTPANPATGDTIVMKAVIKNQGNAPTPAGTIHGVAFTTDGNLGSKVWSDDYRTSIAPGEWVTVTANGGSAGATWDAVAGTYTVQAWVDDVDRMEEENEDNNILTKTMTVKASTPAPTPTATSTPRPTQTPAPTPGNNVYGADANPTGNPIGGGNGYTNIVSRSSADFIVDTKSELLSALQSARSGDVIYIEGNANIDMSGTYNTRIPAGVTLASNRGENGAPGGRIYQSKQSNPPSPAILFRIDGQNVRITGLRIEGPEKNTNSVNYKPIGIYCTQRNSEIDNCEIWGWCNAGINMAGTGGSERHGERTPMHT